MLPPSAAESSPADKQAAGGRINNLFSHFNIARVTQWWKKNRKPTISGPERVLWFITVLGHAFFTVYAFLDFTYGPWKTQLPGPVPYMAIYPALSLCALILVFMTYAKQGRVPEGVSSDTSVNATQQLHSKVAFSRRLRGLYYFWIFLFTAFGWGCMMTYWDRYGNNSPGNVSGSSLDVLNADLDWRNIHGYMLMGWSVGWLLLMLAFQEHNMMPSHHIDAHKIVKETVNTPDPPPPSAADSDSDTE